MRQNKASPSHYFERESDCAVFVAACRKVRYWVAQTNPKSPLAIINAGLVLSPCGVIAMTLVSGVWAAEGAELLLVLAA